MSRSGASRHQIGRSGGDEKRAEADSGACPDQFPVHDLVIRAEAKERPVVGEAQPCHAPFDHVVAVISDEAVGRQFAGGRGNAVPVQVVPGARRRPWPSR